jgi:hypothetical protein
MIFRLGGEAFDRLRDTAQGHIATFHVPAFRFDDDINVRLTHLRPISKPAFQSSGFLIDSGTTYSSPRRVDCKSSTPFEANSDASIDTVLAFYAFRHGSHFRKSLQWASKASSMHLLLRPRIANTRRVSATMSEKSSRSSGRVKDGERKVTTLSDDDIGISIRFHQAG